MRKTSRRINGFARFQTASPVTAKIAAKLSWHIIFRASCQEQAQKKSAVPARITDEFNALPRMVSLQSPLNAYEVSWRARRESSPSLCSVCEAYRYAPKIGSSAPALSCSWAINPVIRWIRLTYSIRWVLYYFWIKKSSLSLTSFFPSCFGSDRILDNTRSH